MISGTLLKRNIISCIKLFIIIFAVLCMYTTIIIYMFNPELADMLNKYQQALPDMMAAVGMEGVASNLLEWVKIYLYGFIMKLFPLIFIIIANHKLLMGYIDSGSMANLLATPNSRGKIIRTQLLSSVLMIILLIAAMTGVGIISCQAMFPGELDIPRYLLLNVSTCLLQLVISGIAFGAACVFSESKYYYSIGAGLPILFFLIQMVSNMGDKMKDLKYVTIYTLLPANQIVAGESGHWGYELAMAVLAIVLYGAGAIYFTRRDMSV